MGRCKAGPLRSDWESDVEVKSHKLERQSARLSLGLSGAFELVDKQDRER